MHKFCYLCSIKRNIFRSERIAIHIAPVGRRTVCLCAAFRYACACNCCLPIGERAQYALRIAQHSGGLRQATATAIWLHRRSPLVSTQHTQRWQPLAHTPSGTRLLVMASADKCTRFACHIAIPSKPYRTQYQSNSGTFTHNATQFTDRTYILPVS